LPIQLLANHDADVIKIGRDFEELAYPRNIYFWADSSHKVPFKKVLANQSAFRYDARRIPEFLAQGMPYWFKFKLQNTDTISKNIFIQTNLFYYDIELYLTDSSGKTMTNPTKYSWKMLLKNRPYPTRNAIFPVSLPPQKTITVFLRLQKEYGTLWLPMSLKTEKKLIIDQAKDNLSEGLFFGVTCFVLAFAILFFFTLKDKIYIYYALYVTFNALFFVSYKDFQVEWFNTTLESFRGNSLHVFWSLWAIFVSISFYTNLLEIDKIKHHWILNGFTFFQVLALLFTFFIFFEVWQVNIPWLSIRFSVSYCYNIYAATFGIFSIYTFAYFWRINHRKIQSILLLLAYLPLFMVLLVNSLVANGLLSTSFESNKMGTFAVMIEFFTMTVALAYRFKIYKEEREKFLLEINAEQQNRLDLIVKTEEKERQRIAQDLHDSVGQFLIGTRIKINNLVTKKEENIHKELNEISELLNKAVQEVRTVSHNLTPIDIQKRKFEDVLRVTTERMTISSNLLINFQSLGDIESIPENHKVNLYRVIQEILTNITKHAKAQNVFVQLSVREEEISLLIEDDGIGFDSTKIADFQGIGLKNIQSRVSLMNGELTIDSHSQKGTTILIDIPK
jgi:signal transduction histidine kinase